MQVLRLPYAGEDELKVTHTFKCEFIVHTDKKA